MTNKEEKEKQTLNVGFSFADVTTSGEFFARNVNQIKELVEIYLNKIKKEEKP